MRRVELERRRVEFGRTMVGPKRTEVELPSKRIARDPRKVESKFSRPESERNDAGDSSGVGAWRLRGVVWLPNRIAP